MTKHLVLSNPKVRLIDTTPETVEYLYHKVYDNVRNESRIPLFEDFLENIVTSDVIFDYPGVLFRMNHIDKTYPYIHALIYSHHVFRERSAISQFLSEVIYDNGFLGIQAIVPECEESIQRVLRYIGFRKLDIIDDYFVHRQIVLKGVRYILDRREV